jgi:hypothetical protein
MSNGALSTENDDGCLREQAQQLHLIGQHRPIGSPTSASSAGMLSDQHLEEGT